MNFCNNSWLLYYGGVLPSHPSVYYNISNHGHVVVNVFVETMMQIYGFCCNDWDNNVLFYQYWKQSINEAGLNSA